MKAQKLNWLPTTGWTTVQENVLGAQLVLLFASRSALEASTCAVDLRAAFPKSHIIGCSTGGQISGEVVGDDMACAIAMNFSHSSVRVARAFSHSPDQSFEAGVRLGAQLMAPDLRSILVLSDGLQVNGTALVGGLRSIVPDEIVVTGGLAGDGADFKRTLVVADSEPSSGQIVAVGLYGASLIVGHGNAGGWDTFGPKRVVTKSCGNVLWQLDGKPALALYKSYLGEESDGLPGTALLYPLLIRDPSNPDHGVVRTVLGVDHDNETMTFAGDIPEGWSAQLMRGYFDRLSDGAGEAARAAAIGHSASGSDVAAILISCIGRRILMGQSIIDEVKAAIGALDSRTAAVGFYSYGEISPHAVTGHCELHNQTMTVTTFSERV